MLMKSPTAIPSLANLAYILRHRELWPEGFAWDFSVRRTCAMGLSDLLWGQDPATLPDALTMPTETFNNIFCRTSTKVWLRIWRIKFHCYSMDHVTPEMVADQIDAFLAQS
jgi:hypothetical protein